MVKPRSRAERRQPTSHSALPAKWARALPLLGTTGLLILLLVSNHRVVTPLQQLPSPLYGGDYYFQLGQTNHVAAGGNPLESSTLNSALPAYFVVYSAIVGWTARLTGIDAIRAELLFSYLIAIASFLAVLWCCRCFGASLMASGLSALLFAATSALLIVKYTDFTATVIVPWFVGVLHRFRRSGTWAWSVTLGIAFGVLSLAHGVGFIGASLTLGMVALVDHRHLVARPRRWDKRVTKGYAVAGTLGLAIALLYWWQPIFVHHLQPKDHFFQQDRVGDPARVWHWFVADFLSFGSLEAVLRSGLRLVGAVALVSAWRKHDPRVDRGWVVCFVVALILAFHDIVTFNVFGVHLVPSRLGMYMQAVLPILVAWAADLIWTKLAKYTALRGLAIATAAALALLVSQRAATNRMLDPWYKKGATPLRKPYPELAAYLRDHSDVYDTVLTTKELGFALNAVSGRKLVSVRRGQNDPFIAMDPREIDHAVLLYGDEGTDRRALLHKYGVKFLYWDDFWLPSEYHFEGQQVTEKNDPLFVYHSPEKERALKDRGVKYYIQNTWPDPAMQGPGFHKYDLLLVAAQNYRSFERPWHAALDPFLAPVWSYAPDGKATAVLYRIVEP